MRRAGEAGESRCSIAGAAWRRWVGRDLRVVGRRGREGEEGRAMDSAEYSSLHRRKGAVLFAMQLVPRVD